MSTSQELFVRGLVLEDETHGPQVCLGALATSMPPRGGGPDLVGWDWSAVDGSERVGLATMGYYLVVGTYAGGSLTVTRPPVVATFETERETLAREERERRWLASWAEPVGWSDAARERVVDQLWDQSDVLMVDEQENGLLVVEVAHDDGTLQSRLAAAYPGGLVAVRSALRPVGELTQR